MSGLGGAARGVAVDALSELDRGRSGERWLRAQGLPTLADGRDRAHALALYQGVARRRRIIDELLAARCSRPLDRLDPVVRNALRVAVAEQVELDRVPLHATVHTVVEVVKRRQGRGAAGFVNGVVRGLGRDGAFQLPPVGLNDLPPWLARDWVRDLGEERALERARALLKPAPLCLRVRPGAGEEVRNLGRPVADGVDAVRLSEEEGNPAALPGFGGVEWVVQDAGAVAVADLLGVRSGDAVVDLCAAPGGKSLQFADQAGPEGRVLAVDRSLERVGRFPRGGEGAAAIETLEAEVEALDAAALDAAGFHERLRIFLDAPCTAVGTLRRHPEILWLRRREDGSNLARRQLRLLKVAADLLSPGGRLVYAVCSPDRREGHEVVRQFLRERSEFELSDRTEAVTSPLLERGDGGLWQTLPERDPVDGFVAAILERS